MKYADRKIPALIQLTRRRHLQLMKTCGGKEPHSILFGVS